MVSDTRRALWAIALVLLVGSFLVVSVPRLLDLAAGAESEIVSELKNAEKEGVALEIPGVDSRLQSSKLQFERLAVTVSNGNATAVVSATLSFSGKLGETEVGSVGVEQIPFIRKSGSWQPKNGYAPRLCAAVRALEQRRRAIETENRELLSALSVDAYSDAGLAVSAELQAIWQLKDRRYRVLAWYLRQEREEVLIREEYQLEGTTPQRPINEKKALRLYLQPKEGEFYFSKGLM